VCLRERGLTYYSAPSHAAVLIAAACTNCTSRNGSVQCPTQIVSYSPQHAWLPNWCMHLGRCTGPVQISREPVITCSCGCRTATDPYYAPPQHKGEADKPNQTAVQALSSSPAHSCNCTFTLVHAAGRSVGTPKHDEMTPRTHNSRAGTPSTNTTEEAERRPRRRRRQWGGGKTTRACKCPSGPPPCPQLTEDRWRRWLLAAGCCRLRTCTEPQWLGCC